MFLCLASAPRLIGTASLLRQVKKNDVAGFGLLLAQLQTQT